MIHLFSKVYLKADKLLKSSRERIVISKEFGGLSNSESTVLHDLSDATPIPAFYTCKSYEEFIGKEFHHVEKDFLVYLLKYDETKRLTIYCDPQTMLFLITKFLKTIYPTWSVEFYIRMVNYYLTYFLEVLGTGRTYAGNIKPADAQELYAQYYQILADSKRSTLHDLWNNTEVWHLTKSEHEFILKNTSMELQLATVLLEPDWKYAQVFKDKMVRAVKKELITEFCSAMRSVILKSLVNFKFLEPDTQFDVTKHSLYDLATMHHDYSFLVDEKFRPEFIDHVYDNYDMSVIKRINDKLWNHPFGFEIDWSPLIKNDLTFADIIEFEMARPLNRLLFRYGEYYETVNSYLLDFILDAARDNNVDSLRPLRLL